MFVQAITRPFNTADITVTSNVTSLHTRGDKVTKLSERPGEEPIIPTSISPDLISIDLAVQDPRALPDVLTAAESLELTLNTEDALELGLLLLAMSLENTSRDRVSATLNRLTQLLEELS